MAYSKEFMNFVEVVFKVAIENNRSTINNKIKGTSPFSININKYISSLPELSIYIDLDLKEKHITRPCLCYDIDPCYMTPSGNSNLERMLKGESPYDHITGTKLNIHHIGQKFDSPFAELPQKIHIETASSILHDVTTDSWRWEDGALYETELEIKRYWKLRGEMLKNEEE